jgi:hypothetical protein
MHATRNPAPPVSLAQPLRDAADYLESHGWIRHHLYSSRHTSTPMASLVGALAIVCFGYPNPEPYDLPDDRRADADAFTAFVIANMILGDFVGVDEMTDSLGNPIVYTLSDWNDEEFQTVACVIATLRAAAGDYDRDFPGGTA